MWLLWMIKLSDYYKSNFSQFGQDGVIEKLIELINIKSKYFVEFGSSGNDEGFGNTPNLRRLGWNGLLMDKVLPDPKYIQYEFYQENITADNIEILLALHGVPKDFGFLSVDIDGQDYWVWKAIQNWNPSIVCIESNHYIDRNKSLSVPLDDNFEMTSGYYFGASQKALLNLGKQKGYSLVAICVTDMIFVKTDLTDKLRMVNSNNRSYPPFYGTNNIDILDTAQTNTWVNNTIRKDVESREWTEVI